MTLYLMCGLAFAGKSTLAAAIAARAGAVVVSLDDINERRGFAGGLGISVEDWTATHRVALAEAERALTRGESVVVDDTNCFRFLRDDYRALALRCGAACLVVYVDAPLSLVRSRMRENERTLARPRVTDEVLQELMAKFEAPRPDEASLTYSVGMDPDRWVTTRIPAAGA